MSTATKVIVALVAGLVLSATAVGAGVAAAPTHTVTKVVNHTVVRTVTKPVIRTVTKVVPGPTITNTVTVPGAPVTPQACLTFLDEADSQVNHVLDMVHDLVNNNRAILAGDFTLGEQNKAQFQNDSAQYNANVPSYNADQALCKAAR